ncbi:MAG: FMN-binding negative transcriptional regulator [Bacteroidota bacterium]|nr:FMN-binding negative transcriptional regulator [Bacteroidota bacterium]
MYSLPYFKEPDEKVVREFIDKHPFAFVTGCDANNRPVATQLPVFLEEDGSRLILRGHMMKNTDHHKAFIHNRELLVVFTGPHAYVSATWYSDPHQASTWNYMSVHVRGTIRFLGDEELVNVLRKVTLYFENNNPQSTTIYDNLSPEYTLHLMKAIVAFEIEVTAMENVFKLSQNRDKQSFLNIIEKLEVQGGDSSKVAEEMRKRLNTLYPL